MNVPGEENRKKIETLTLDKKDEEQDEIRVYGLRWLVLGLFILYSTTINGQWLEYSIISNIVTRYYNVSSFAVECTAMSNMFYYVVFIFPAAYYSELAGVRRTLILGSCLSCLGAWIKVYATSPDKFFWLLVGQSMVASCQVLMLPMPGRIAAKWFGSTELSTATSFGIFGTQLGIALSFLLPPIFVKNHANSDDVGSDLRTYQLYFAVATTITLLLVGLLFQEEPKLPPSETRALQKARQGVPESFLPAMRRLARNRSFLLLCNSYGLGIGVLNAVSTLLNPVFLAHFENGEEDAGRIGLLIIVPGMLGSVAFGVILDKTHKFKQTAVSVYSLSFLGQLLFTASILLEVKWLVYLAATLLGIFISGYLALGYELATEFTYPENEQLTAGILNIVNNVYGMILVLALSWAMKNFGDAWVHAGLLAALFLGLLLTLITPDEQRRQDAYKTATGYRKVASSDKPRTALIL